MPGRAENKNEDEWQKQVEFHRNVVQEQAVPVLVVVVVAAGVVVVVVVVAVVVVVVEVVVVVVVGQCVGKRGPIFNQDRTVNFTILMCF